jgi:cysteine desulfuration protein SufE
MMSIDDVQDEIVEEFELFGDDNDLRNSYIIDLGRKLAPLADDYHTEAHIVKGCQALVWLHTVPQDGVLYFQADSNAAIPKGLIALAVRLYSGRTPQEIVQTPPDFIERIGMSKHISSSRSNGLLSVIGRIKQEAADALEASQKEEIHAKS